ncbi:MAG: response regulator [Desulfomonile tiedjei]|nr:response regulator [Desulfomonile tiedjei]
MKRRISVLIADDEIIIRRKVCMMLGDRFILDQAPTAQSVRERDLAKYDAVLLDIVFPDGNGIDLCREIKQKSPHFTVVISSSMESVDAWNQAFQAGADGYLEKRELLALDPRKIQLMIENLVERNELRQKNEETHRRQVELMAVLSHDVRAPFQALLGTIDLLRKSSIPVEAAQSVETLYGCAKDQLSFINSLLELLRLESGVTELRPLQIDLNLPVSQSVQGLKMLASAKGIALDVKLAAELPQVVGDIGKTCQLVGNLVSNAIKFTPRGGKVSIRTVAVRRNGVAGVEIVVADTGVGIVPSHQERIFQRFRRGRDRGTEGETGTGLGLSICKEIVQLHGGTLEVSSQVSKGSIFVVWFPAKTAIGPAASGGHVRETSEAQLTNRFTAC